MREIEAHFSKERRYFENSIGREFDFTQSSGPYEYLLGALSGCLYSTFMSIKDEDLTFDSVDITVRGEKRQEEPTFLENTYLHVQAKGASSKEKFEKSFILASEKCSIFQTIKKVSKMHLEVSFS
ncbi:MAG TPA: OsmC family protein [Candidatus Ornithospirochaeta avicola]|uniref:OsmC family protein n=1 Tax=Candidatus Ornithospirochaeta avicola TaxID=2840896 RepID=A0A9D1PTK1_9SPIO|nr:OsmC family protein [Candidatus Ornithospirochaeta avicola]